MPELAEVEWYRKQWNVGLAEPVMAVRLHPQNRVFRGSDTDALQRNLIGQKVLGSCTRGKRMLFRFSGDNWLSIHLGMTGKTHLEPPSFQPAKHDHLVLWQRHRALVFTDSRQFGRIRFSHSVDEPDWWRSDVPEIASSDYNRDVVDRFLSRHAKAPIKAVLLMQNGFPGIGNWMADEILWRARIHPAKRTGALNAAKRAALFQQTKFVVRQSLRTLGKDFSDPPRNWLIHQRWSKTGVCPKHRTPLRRATVGGRTTAWCPKCQR
jgi:formamidopyrimidine-DNA glycosylase